MTGSPVLCEQNAEGVILIDSVRKEIAWCMTYDQADECCGASGHKLRTVCVWCQRYWKFHGIQRREETISMGETSSIERLNEKIEEILKNVNEMAKSIAVMEVKLEAVSKDVDEMKQTPKNRWNSVVNTIITVLVTGFVAYLIAQANMPVAK